MNEKSNKMEEDSSSTSTAGHRQVKFNPKPPRKTRKTVEAKIEELAGAEAEATQAKELVRRVNEGSRRRGPIVEKKSEAAQVAFGYAGKQTSIRAFGSGSSSTSEPQVPVSQDPNSQVSFSQDPASQDANSQDPVSQVPFSQDPVSDDDHILSHEKKKKDYAEPWNYDGNYPVTLPLRKPNSGNPELLDKEEFGEASETLEYDENSENPAAELGLLEESEVGKMLFLQLPSSLPIGSPENVWRLEELPAGFMGKMQVYKSGAVKLKLGETLFDVSPGSDSKFPKHVAAINVAEKQCCELGDIDKKAIITPDLDSLRL